MTQAEFLEHCLALGPITSGDKQNIKEFFKSESGMKLLGALQEEWEGKTFTGAMSIKTTDPYACASELAGLQGHVHGLGRAIDLIMENLNVSSPS